MKSDACVDMRLRCLEMANERAFDARGVIPLAEEYRRFCMGQAQAESNVVDMQGNAK